jgi:hypothetical protein
MRSALIMRAQREQVSTFLGKVHKGMHGRALPVDDISVQLRVDAGRGLNTAGLQHALHGLR